MVGHSQGEIAAACVAGGLSLEDGARVVALRSRLVRDRLAGQGGMMSVALPVDEVEQLLPPLGSGCRSRRSTGRPRWWCPATRRRWTNWLVACDADGVRARRMPVDYASHSAQVEAIEAELLDVLAPISPAVGGGAVLLDGDRRVRRHGAPGRRVLVSQPARPVRFEPAVRTLWTRRVLHRDAPHPVLTMAVEDTAGPAPLTVVSGRCAVTRAACTGSPPRWPRRTSPGWPSTGPPCAATPRRVSRCRPTRSSGAATGSRRRSNRDRGARPGPAQHPLLDAIRRPRRRPRDRLHRSALGASSLAGRPRRLGPRRAARGRGVPGLALYAGAQSGAPVIEQLALTTPLALDGDAVALQVTVATADAEGHAAPTILPRPDDPDTPAGWTQHATATLVPERDAGTRVESRHAADDATAIESTSLYDRLRARRHRVRRGDPGGPEPPLAARRRVLRRAPRRPRRGGGGPPASLHPALLDAALQPAALLCSERRDSGRALVLVRRRLGRRRAEPATA